MESKAPTTILEVQSVQIFSGARLSNGAEYGKLLVKKNGVESTQYFLDFYGDKRVLLIIWDGALESFVKKLVAVFVLA